VRWHINRRLVRKILVGSEFFYQYRGDRYPDYLNHGNAVSFIAPTARRYCTGTGLDIGAGDWPLPGAIPIQDAPRQNTYALNGFADASLDYIFSSHCLEHLGRWREALGLWARKIKPGGIMFLYLPHESMQMWRRCGPWVGTGHAWIPTLQVLRPFLETLGWTLSNTTPAETPTGASTS
jgi:SAM-dependent methyltransferase